MTKVDQTENIGPLGLCLSEMLNVLDGMNYGVLITDQNGKIVYYNKALSEIEGCAPAQALHHNITDVYELTDRTSLTMQCLSTGKAFINRAFYYRTVFGKVANTIHSVYPLKKGQDMCGAICLVQEYTVLEKNFHTIRSFPPKKRTQSKTKFTFDSIIGETADIRNAVNTAMMAADTPSPIMICGETGTGKELFAQAIHNLSARRKSNFIPINCAAIPENLLEGILFGTSKGAFTGATDKQGLFEQANGGTLFLDELNSMPIGLQAKILRVLQERKVRRIGSLREVGVDLKIISSVNQPPHTAIAENFMRPDLFYRLGVVLLPIPPLRERREDIPLLSHHFLEKHSKNFNKKIADISEEVLCAFLQYNWPGNVRELEHVVEGAMNFVEPGEMIGLKHLQSHLPICNRRLGQHSAPDSVLIGAYTAQEDNAMVPSPLFETASNSRAAIADSTGDFFVDQANREKELIEAALSKYGGNVTKSAECIGVSRQVLHYKMKKHGLNRKSFQTDRSFNPPAFQFQNNQSHIRR